MRALESRRKTRLIHGDVVRQARDVHRSVVLEIEPLLRFFFLLHLWQPGPAQKSVSKHSEQRAVANLGQGIETVAEPNTNMNTKQQPTQKRARRHLAL